MNLSNTDQDLKALYQEISTLSSLAPSPKVNQLFQKLVAFALDPKMFESELSSKEIAHLQQLCAQAEFEMEAYWVKRVLASKDPKAELLLFPYYKNYEKLTKLEWFSLLSCENHLSHSVLFIGSGPLPLTAIVLAENYIDKLTVLDYDDEAINLSMRLIKKLGLEKKITVVKGDAKTFSDYKTFNTVFVAALAGALPKDKQEILQKLKTDTPNQSHIIARSSWGAREILYTPIDNKLFQLFKPLIEVRPHNDVVNSIIIFENEK